MGIQYWQAAGMTTPVDAFDFPGFVLTTKDGTRYAVDREDLGEHFLFDNTFVHAYGDASLSRIRQRTGDRIEIETAGIEHFDASNIKTRALVERTATLLMLSVVPAAGVTPVRKRPS